MRRLCRAGHAVENGGSTEDLGGVVKGGSIGLWQVILGVIYGPLRMVTQRDPLGQIRTEKRVLGRARK